MSGGRKCLGRIEVERWWKDSGPKRRGPNPIVSAAAIDNAPRRRPPPDTPLMKMSRCSSDAVQLQDIFGCPVDVQTVDRSVLLIAEAQDEKKVNKCSDDMCG